MQEVTEHGSEVAQLLTQISSEYEAAQRGLNAFAQGMSKHEFITARMKRVGHLHSQLRSLVGESSIALVADTLSKVH
jgi:hypothetical protein